MARSTIALVTLGALALAAAPADAKGHGRTITIKAKSKIEHVQAVNTPRAGAPAGDVLFSPEHLSTARGRRMGGAAAFSTRLFDQTSLCTGTYKLPGGQVMVQL